MGVLLCGAPSRRAVEGSPAAARPEYNGFAAQRAVLATIFQRYFLLLAGRGRTIFVRSGSGLCYTALTMPNAQKLFIYARKSTDDRDRQVQSIPDQISELRAFARSNSISVAEVLIEKQSAKSPGRKVFEAMLSRIAEGEAEGILAWHPDRLARNMTDGARLVELVETKGANLVFPTYHFDSTPHGIFCLSLAFGQSKLYVDNLRENVTRGMKNKARRGIYPAKPPVGYVNNRNTRGIDPDPEYAPLVVSLFEKYSTGRYTLDEV